MFYNIKIGKFVVIYIITTYILYLFLPSEEIRSANTKEIYSVVFLAFVCIAFYFGCKSVKIEKKYFPNKICTTISPIILTTFLLIVFIDYALYIVDLINLGYLQASLSMGESYANLVLEGGLSGTSIWGQFYVLLSPLRVFMCAYCVYYYKHLRLLNKVLVLLILTLTLLNAIFSGQQVGIGNAIIIVIVPFFIRKLKDDDLTQVKKIAIVFVSMFVLYFLLNQFLRAEAFGYELSDSINDADNIYYKLFGQRIGSGVVNFIGYFSHGYLGLNYSLQLPFKWTFGYGGSKSLDQYLEQYLGFASQFNNTYPMRVFQVFNYDCQIRWPTAFAWWASDLSFPGVVLMMYFLGKLTCLVFRDAYYYSNVYAIAFMIQVTILLIFLSMNNQAFQAKDSLLTTIFLFVLWISKRHSANKRCIKLMNE